MSSVSRPRRLPARGLVAAGSAALLFLLGCSDEAATESDDAGAPEGAAPAEGDDPGSDENGGEEFATATWMGEELSFVGVSCGTLPSPEDYEIRGRGEGFYLQARFSVDIAATDDSDNPVLESEQPHRLTLFFDGDNGTIADGEGYEARGADLAGLDASATQVAGTVELAPDTSTQADEVNPDGGTIELEIRC